MNSVLPVQELSGTPLVTSTMVQCLAPTGLSPCPPTEIPTTVVSYFYRPRGQFINDVSGL